MKMHVRRPAHPQDTHHFCSTKESDTSPPISSSDLANMVPSVGNVWPRWSQHTAGNKFSLSSQGGIMVGFYDSKPRTKMLNGLRKYQILLHNQHTLLPSVFLFTNYIPFIR